MSVEERVERVSRGETRVNNFQEDGSDIGVDAETERWVEPCHLSPVFAASSCRGVCFVLQLVLMASFVQGCLVGGSCLVENVFVRGEHGEPLLDSRASAVLDRLGVVAVDIDVENCVVRLGVWFVCFIGYIYNFLFLSLNRPTGPIQS